MEDTCNDCMTWEEEMFWKNFKSIRFTKFLRGDFLKRLEIPEKFAKNIKKKLPQSVTLKGPSGTVWNVGLTKEEDSVFFGPGWKNFVKDHSLVEDDFLIFKYNGVSHFSVRMFEGNSLCEKASSYFVRKCVHTESDSGNQAKRKMNEDPEEIVHNSSQCGLESSPEKSTNNDIGTRPSRQPSKPAATCKKMRKVDSPSNKMGKVGSPTRSTPRRSLGGKELSNFAREVKAETEFEDTRMDFKAPLTQFEKINVIMRAQEALTIEGFMIVMKPTHVARRFYMAIPTAWVAKHHLKENADVILRLNKNTWKTRFYYHISRDCGGLSGGWRNFVIDNNLEEHDVCVFEPANSGKKPIILDVTIFRVLQTAEAAIPLNQVDPTPSQADPLSC